RGPASFPDRRDRLCRPVRSPPLVHAALVLAQALLLGGCYLPKGAEGASLGSPGAVARPGARPARAELELPNGLRVGLEENHAAPLVALQAGVAVGAADEPAGLAGAAHFYEHFLRAGTGGVGAAGGAVNAWTSFDETVVEAVVAAPFLDSGLDALAS